jgi:hypothetical protein
MQFTTKTDAWNYLANLWEKPKIGMIRGKQTPHITPSRTDGMCFGLCQSLIQIKDMLTVRIYDRMQRQLNQYLKVQGWNGAYLFDLNLGGAEQRATACRMMAKESV